MRSASADRGIDKDVRREEAKMEKDGGRKMLDDQKDGREGRRGQTWD